MLLSDKAAARKDATSAQYYTEKNRKLFQHRHYAVIARALASIRRIEEKHDVAYTLVGIFARDNSNFDRDRFLQAAGVTDPVEAAK